jgi:hypothetical protein
MSIQASQISEQDTDRILGVLLSEIQSLGMTNAQSLVAAAGIIVSAQHWQLFRAHVNTAFRRMPLDDRLIVLGIIGDGLSGSERVQDLLAKHGFEFVDGTFVPTAILDQRESRYLPPSSASELAKATNRLVNGDETGAITSACGAVDILMQQLYAMPKLSSLGNPGNASFSTKVNTAASRLEVFEELETDFTTLGMKHDDAASIVTEMRKATNHAAQMLQVLRRCMGDVHGSKPAMRRAAYDAIKWASAICALFDRRQGS